MFRDSIITILLMGLVTYMVRVSGYWLAGRVTLNHYLETWLKYLPGCIIISIIAPLLLHSDGKEWLGVLVTIVLMIKSKNIFIAMLMGIIVVLVLRQLM